jgi:hypothetical protein
MPASVCGPTPIDDRRSLVVKGEVRKELDGVARESLELRRHGL